MIMNTLFYILFGLNIIYELINIVRPNYIYHIHDFIKAYLQQDESYKTPEKTKKIIIPTFLLLLCIIQQALYSVLTVVGLFTHQWFLFACIIIISIIGSFIQNNHIIQNNHRTDWYARLGSVISAVLIITIIVNR